MSIAREVRRAITDVSNNPKKIEAVMNEMTPTTINGTKTELT